MVMSKPPSKKQLGYLKGLGYRGTPPETSWEASRLIDELKAGKTPKQVAKSLNKKRESKANRSLQSAKEYVRLVAEQNDEYREAVGSAMVVGFRLKVSKVEMTPENEVYHRGFLPLEIAVKYPEILAVAGVEDVDPISRNTQPISPSFFIAWANCGNISRAVE